MLKEIFDVRPLAQRSSPQNLGCDESDHQGRETVSTWTDRVKEVDRLVANRHHGQAVQAAGLVLEEVLRDIYRRIASELPVASQEEVAAKLAKIGKDKSVEMLTLGQLVGLFREARL